MADLNAMQSPGGNSPKMSKGLIIGIIVAVLVILALILFWPRGSNDTTPTAPEFGETDTFDTGTDLNTGVEVEGNAPPVNEAPFPDVDDGLDVEF